MCPITAIEAVAVPTGGVKLSEATWTELGETTAEVALVPVGSTEQHGPHAPLGTDTIAAEAVAEAADDRLDEPTTVVAPPVHVGVSAEHRAFDGTLWVSPETFRAYVRESVESLFTHGVDRAVLVNGHGGNVEALAEVARRLSREGAVGWRRRRRRPRPTRGRVHLVRGRR
ncbi:MAG: Creatinine amidohydrolase [halophilic archaeon J07HB67]|nr:MAG: Creatinine amidohydrolase [halophilic archaeon J07HB67]